MTATPTATTPTAATPAPAVLSHRLPALTAWLATALGAERVEITNAHKLSGGAVQENWRLDVAITGGPQAARSTLVLRTDAATPIAISLDRASEYAVLVAAAGAGVLVAQPLARSADPGVIGRPFSIQTFVEGAAQARKLVRDAALRDGGGEALAERMGAALADIHAITPTRAHGVPLLPVLGAPPTEPARHEVARLRALMDTASERRPALEYVLARLDREAPASGPVTLVHGDYRTGNYLVSAGMPQAILDWEFAHWGDPMEDIGWFTARCWRFGQTHLTAGGIGSLTAFKRGYEQRSGVPVDWSALAYWQVMAAAKWAAVALLQGERYNRGERRIELALTGLMTSELELEALDGLTHLAPAA